MQAAGVQVWLGASDAHAPHAFEFISSAIPQFTMGAQLQHIPLPNDPIWHSIGKFFARSWFERVWVIQEIVLANYINVLCGNHFLSWDQIHAFVVIIQTTPAFRFLFDRFRSRFLDVIQLQALRSGFRASLRRGLDERGFLFLLDLIRRRESTENVDRVYGGLGAALQSIREKVNIDYSPQRKQCFWEAYIELGKALVETPGFRLLMQAPSKERMAGLPTWCPNLSSRRSMTDNWKHFNAGVLPNPRFDQGPYPPHVSLEEQSNAIIVRGIIMDTVGLIYCPPPEAFQSDQIVTRVTKFNNFIESLHPIFLLLYSNETTARSIGTSERSLNATEEAERWKHKVWVKTLVADTMKGGEPYPPDAIANHFYELGAHYRDIERGTIPEYEPPNVHTYRMAMAEAWYGTSFFITPNGQFGLGPADMLPTDKICVCFTAHTPFVLRRYPGTDSFDFVGPAYIHDFMDGAAFKARDPAISYQSFTIH